MGVLEIKTSVGDEEIVVDTVTGTITGVVFVLTFSVVTSVVCLVIGMVLVVTIVCVEVSVIGIVDLVDPIEMTVDVTGQVVVSMVTIV